MCETKNKLLKSFYTKFQLNKKISSRLQEFIRQVYREVDIRYDGNIFYSKQHFKNIKIILKDQFHYFWKQKLMDDNQSQANGGNKLRTYRQFKTSIKFENYLNLSSHKLRSTLARLRLSSHCLNIESLRYSSNAYIPPEDRLCLQCHMAEIENEQHFVVCCPRYSLLRDNLFNPIIATNHFFTDYNVYQKFMWLMTNEALEFNQIFSQFIESCLKLRK
jgi:hypothetical protein